MGVLYIVLVITTAWEMRLTLAAAIITRIMYNIEDKKAAVRQRLIAFFAIIWIAAAWAFTTEFLLYLPSLKGHTFL